uniref:Uncharacterized protein n=1 Tax=Panagrolaimus sp. PS1159 TaxID=55785 RepID=A0AC35F287_9BILA
YLSEEGRYDSASPRKSLSPRNFRCNDREASRDRSDSRGPPSLDRNTSFRDGRASSSDGGEVENKQMIFISGLPQRLIY